MEFDRGEVWWGPAPHKSTPSYRPWVVVSDQSHPFSHTECIVLAMTTQRHTDGIPVPDDAWIGGGSKQDAYISPWYAATFKHQDFDRQQGQIDERVLRDALTALHSYTPVPPG